jgi:sigma-B regulation protein RsbU (phosphoserine phosphatase)
VAPQDSLFDSAACGLMQTKADGTIVRVNRLFAEWVGSSPAALVGRRRFQDLLTVGGRIFHQTHWAPLLEMQGSIAEVKLELLHESGAAIPMVLNACRHHQGDETLYHLAAFVARDRDQYERELLLSRKRLEEALAEVRRLHADASDRALFAEQMVGIVSHDLRNPLSSIGLGLTLLGRGELPQGQRHTLDRVSRALDRANRLVADLLDFTQARVGRGLSVAYEEIELHRTLSLVVDELALAYPARTLRHIPEGEGTCQADPHRLGQLVGNLVSNAMAYGSPASPVTVTSAVLATSFAVSVHNEGAPIPAEIQGSIFEPMTRGADPGKARRSVGLGLYIVRQIAESHRGEAVVESSLEQGTTFTVTVPRPIR